MSTKVFTNPTGAFGNTADGDVMAQVVGEFKVYDVAATTITKGQILQIDPATYSVYPVDTADTDIVIGVALESVSVPIVSGATYQGPKTVRVCLLGVCEVASGGTSVAAGATLGSNASGQAIASSFADNDYTLGTALDGTGAVAGALVTALVRPQRTETA